MRRSSALLGILIVLGAMPARAATAPAPAAATATTPTATAGPPQRVAVELTDATPGGVTWIAPPQYSVDMVMTGPDGKPVTMTRTIDGPRIRTEIKADGSEMIMIETGDADGTQYMIMPGEKKAMKISGKMTDQVRTQMKASNADPAATAEPEVKPELLGQETIDGRVCNKYKCVTPEGEGTAWIDAKTNQPVRMTSSSGTMEFKNMRIGQPPATAFEVPKGYEVMDMEAMMSKAQGMGAMPGMGALGGMGGLGVGGMAGGMATGMAGNLGSNLGSSLGSTFGGMLGGPIGSMAGGFLGGKIGGMVGRKAAGVVTGSK